MFPRRRVVFLDRADSARLVLDGAERTEAVALLRRIAEEVSDGLHRTAVVASSASVCGAASLPNSELSSQQFGL